MGVIQDTREEPSLPEMTTEAVFAIEIICVMAMEIMQTFGKGLA